MRRWELAFYLVILLLLGIAVWSFVMWGLNFYPMGGPICRDGRCG